MLEQDEVNEYVQRQLELKEIEINELKEMVRELKKFVQWGFVTISIVLLVVTR